MRVDFFGIPQDRECVASGVFLDPEHQGLAVLGYDGVEDPIWFSGHEEQALYLSHLQVGSY